MPFVRKHHATYVAGLNAALAAKGGAPAKGTLAPEITIAVDLKRGNGVVSPETNLAPENGWLED